MKTVNYLLCFLLCMVVSTVISSYFLIKPKHFYIADLIRSPSMAPATRTSVWYILESLNPLRLILINKITPEKKLHAQYIHLYHEQLMTYKKDKVTPLSPYRIKTHGNIATHPSDESYTLINHTFNTLRSFPREWAAHNNLRVINLPTNSSGIITKCTYKFLHKLGCHSYNFSILTSICRIFKKYII